MAVQYEGIGMMEIKHQTVNTLNMKCTIIEYNSFIFVFNMVHIYRIKDKMFLVLLCYVYMNNVY